MWNPKYFHEMITKRVIITMSVLPSQSWMSPSSPTFWRAVSTRASGWRSRLKTMPVIASDSTYGNEEQQPEDGASGEAPIEQDGERRARTGSGGRATGR